MKFLTQQHDSNRGKSIFFLLILFLVLSIAVSHPVYAALPSDPMTADCDNKVTSECTVCVSKPNFSTPDAGQHMVSQMFLVINNILNKIQSTFYTGIIGSALFQQAIGVGFLIYIAAYGLMIMLNLVSFRSNEVTKRLIKLAIVYALTTTNGWTFFSTWIENPVVGEMNQLITYMANPGSGGGADSCVTAGDFTSGAPVSDTSTTVTLSTGPMAMLFGPMTCVFGSKFIAAVGALITTGFYGWILAALIIWGMIEFSMMILGALLTYVKAIVGLTFLFGVAPIFMACYLFEKTRTLTEGWMNMVIAYALQPVMLFAFLAFYANIVGGALTNLLVNSQGSGQDICYVPWYTMSGLFDINWWRFTNAASAAGGEWINSSAGSGSGLGTVTAPPVQVLNILYFLVLASLGRNFTQYINQLSEQIAGGSGGGAIDSQRVGSWFRGKVMGSESGAKLAKSGTT